MAISASHPSGDRWSSCIQTSLLQWPPRPLEANNDGVAVCRFRGRDIDEVEHVWRPKRRELHGLHSLNLDSPKWRELSRMPAILEPVGESLEWVVKGTSATGSCARGRSARRPGRSSPPSPCR